MNISEKLKRIYIYYRPVFLVLPTFVFLAVYISHDSLAFLVEPSSPCEVDTLQKPEPTKTETPEPLVFAFRSCWW